MAVIYLVGMAIPIVLSILVWLALRWLTRLRSTTRFAVATLTAPSLVIFLYGQTNVGAIERAEAALAVVIYLVITAVVVSLIEWRSLNRA
jgi:hypothetical protein